MNFTANHRRARCFNVGCKDERGYLLGYSCYSGPIRRWYGYLIVPGSSSKFPSRLHRWPGRPALLLLLAIGSSSTGYAAANVFLSSASGRAHLRRFLSKTASQVVAQLSPHAVLERLIARVSFDVLEHRKSGIGSSQSHCRQNRKGNVHLNLNYG
jgi:hypothetical protein